VESRPAFWKQQKKLNVCAKISIPNLIEFIKSSPSQHKLAKMPPRISRGSLRNIRPSNVQPAGRNSKKAHKRALDAFAIASHEHSDRTKVRRSRLGESDVFSHRKRLRDEEEDDEEEDEEEGLSDVKKGKRRRGDDDVDEGSDSEGNTWTMGHVDEGDDSDIDSDEAFGESDEEKFEGWTFRGSSGNKKATKPKKAKITDLADEEDLDIDLEEGESAEEEDEDEDDLGEDAIDLATALDQYEESEEEERQRKAKKGKRHAVYDDSDESPDEVGDLAADGASEFSSDEDEEDEVDRRAQLDDLISSLAAEDKQKQTGRRNAEIHESGAPSEFGISRKVDLMSLKHKVADPARKKALKLLQDDKSSRQNNIAKKIDAPLPKRQQDKLDRAVASQKANETLDRWTDTVKHNRRAEHLSFPLYQPQDGQRMGESRLLPTTLAAPVNSLESTIQSILQQSGLSNGKDDEEQIQKWEELQTNKLPLQEVVRRRAQLRRERELLFREEVRSKRIKKIKSKAYRRVHRKERERILERERNALKADGVDISEDEREYNDRRRAEERMGAKHRESKWAKGIKATGRAAWDEDARSGVTEMARRNEELRRRIEGKDVRNEDEDASDISSEEHEDDNDDDDDDEDGNQILLRQLGRLKENPFSTDQSKLGSMAFMQKAEAARKARNDEDIERMRKELASEESDSDDEDENATGRGRRKFGPSTNVSVPGVPYDQSEFEEKATSDNEERDVNESIKDGGNPTTKSSSILPTGTRMRFTTDTRQEAGSQNPYLVKAKKNQKSDPESDLVQHAHDTISVSQNQKKNKKPQKQTNLEPSSDHGLAGNPTVSAADDDGWQTVTYQNQDDEEVEDDDIENQGIDLNVILRNQALTATAFAGDDVEKEFEEEKKATIDEEDEHIEKNVLPGWGSWAGEGLSKKAQRHGKGQVTYKKKEGIAPNRRKDAKLSKVIINEKRVKANTKYLSSQLPFPFETKDQYERSLRLPKGPEWTTKKTFQDATKPRVMVKQGVIRPMHKPLV
jgi:U3 small nucleolar RNA-associated protein 14